MIVIDMEATSLDYDKGAMVSLGAVDLLEPTRTWYREFRIFEGALVEDQALGVAGFTRSQISDPKKPMFADCAGELIDWMQSSTCTILAGHNVMFDILFLRKELKRAGREWPFGFRSVDLHSVAFCRQWVKTKAQPLDERKRSAMNLDAVSEIAGISFRRNTSHNALEDAKLTAECFSRLLFKKKIFAEFDNIKVEKSVT